MRYTVELLQQNTNFIENNLLAKLKRSTNEEHKETNKQIMVVQNGVPKLRGRGRGVLALWALKENELRQMATEKNKSNDKDAESKDSTRANSRTTRPTNDTNNQKTGATSNTTTTPITQIIGQYSSAESICGAGGGNNSSDDGMSDGKRQ